MIQSEEFFMIRDLKSKGMNVTQIARALDLDRKTVTKWLKSDQLPAYRKKVQRESKLEVSVKPVDALTNTDSYQAITETPRH